MAKKTINSGGKIRRGTNNSALTPGSENQQSAFEEIIGSAVDKIIQRLEDNEDVLSDIYSEIFGLHKWSSNDAIDNLTWHLNDKMTAVLGALYGTTQATADMTSSQWLSKLGKPLAGKEIYAGVVEKLDSILLAINNITGTNGSQKDIPHNIKIDFTGLNNKQFDALSNLFGLLNKNDLQKTVKNTELLKTIIDSDHLGGFIEDIKRLNINTTDINDISNIIQLLKATGDIDDAINLSTIVSLGAKAFTGQIAFTLLLYTMDSIDKAAEKAKKSSKNIKTIGSFVDSIIDSLGDNRLLIISSIIKDLLGVNASLLGIAITSPFAIVGAGMLLLEMTIIEKIVGKVNALDIKDDTEKNAKAIAILVTACGGIMLIGALVGTYVAANIGSYVIFTAVLSSFIVGVIGALNLATRGMDDAKENAEEFAKLLAISGGIMLIGGTIMTMFPILVFGSLLFAAALSAFILSVVSTYSFVSKLDFNDSLKNLDDLMLLVGGSAAIMLIGGGLFVSNPWLIGGTLLFSTMLVAFIGGLTYVYNAFGQGIGEATENADKFAKLIAITGATLLVGGGLFVYNPHLIWSVPLFGVLLLAFITGVTFAYNMFGQGIGEATANAEKFGVLIALSAVSLLIGGWAIIQNKHLIWTIPLFGVLLGLFVTGITLAYGFVSRFLQSDGIKIAQDFMVVVGLSAAALLIGGAFMLIPGMPGAVAAFAVTLSAFVVVMGFAYYEFNKIGKAAVSSALALSALVAISAASLLVGGMMFLQNEGLTEASIMFAVTTAAFVGAFALIAYLLGQIPIKNLVAGVIAIGVITLIIDSFVDTFKKVNELSQVIDKDKIYDTMLAMFALVGGTGLLVGILAGVYAIPGVGLLGIGLVAAALGTLAGIVKIIDMTSDAMIKVAKASSAMAHIEIPDIDSVTEAIGKMLLIAGEMSNLANPAILLTMQAAKVNTMALSSCISVIGKSVRDFSSLVIPEYDDNGKISGYRRLTQYDFDKAAEHIKAIVSTLGNAVIEAYNENPDIFGSGFGGAVASFFGVDTPFARTAKSCAMLGTMISKIAEGVRDYANFRIKTYDENGKVTGSRSFTDADFESAGRNISTILTTLGLAVIKTYKENPEMFTDQNEWWQPGVRTPFGMVAKSLRGIGSLISKVASGIKDYADLRMPIYDRNGKVIGYRTMEDADFKAAGEGISKVLRAIAGAIIDVYNDPANKDMFDASASLLKDIVGNDFGDNPFVIVRKSFEGTGKLISEAIKAINEVSKLEVNVDDAKKKIANVISVLGAGIMEVYNDPANKDMFDAGASLWSLVAGKSAEDTPFVIVKKSLEGTGDLIKKAALAIKEVMAINLGNNPEAKVKKIISMIPAAFSDEALQDIDPDDANDILVGIKSYCTAANELVKAYTTIWKLISNVSSSDGAIVDTLGGSLVKMMSYLNSSISILYTNGQDEASIKTRMDSFAAAMSIYNDSIRSWAAAFKLMPNDYTKYDNFVKGLSAINIEITKIPDLNRFNQQAKTMDSYVKTINSLQTNKIDKLISLSDSIMKMSEQLGSLDEFTDVLANKVTVVLAELSERMEESSSTIKTAEKVQTSRHKKINEALAAIKNLLAKPLNVNVTHKALTESPAGNPSPGTNGDATPTQTTGGGQPSNLENFVTYSGLAPNNTPSETASVPVQETSMSEQRMKEIAKREVTRGINEYEARKDKRRGR